MRAMDQQFTTALDGLTRQNTELQNVLAQSRQQAATELAAPRQEVRGTPLRGSQRLLEKLGEFSGAQDAWRDWSTAFKGCAGAAVQTSAEADGGRCEGGSADPKCHDAGAGSVGTALLNDAHDLQGCKGAALNIVFLARDSEGLEAWRQLTEKHEPKMKTRFAGQTDVHLVLLIPR